MYKLYTDGGSRGNPGKAAAGFFIFDSNEKLIDFDGKYLFEMTNNQAEYEGLIEGLKLAKKNRIKELEVFMDSQLIVKQLNGEYKVKNEGMKKLFAEVISIRTYFDQVAFTHIPRENNSFADRMVNIILDEHE